MKTQLIKKQIELGHVYLGIELGSTRIKSVLMDQNYKPIASGSFEWENKFESGYWTYALDDVWSGVQKSYQSLAYEVEQNYAVPLIKIQALGISAMMHGYLVVNSKGELLTPFRTWRNTTTEQAAAALTEKFSFNIPQRWSIAHLYQAMLNGETHVKEIDYMTTLAGYVHWKLTGERVVGAGEASGMFPLDSHSLDYDQAMLQIFDDLTESSKLAKPLKTLLPKVLPAGAFGGTLTPEGAQLLDPSGKLMSGILLCPPEGDAGTGMVATNSVSEKTGNISAGTSIFAMIVLEKKLSRVYTEIDMVTTPAGKPVAMVHCNNCSSDLDAWVKLFGSFAEISGMNLDKTALYTLLYEQALSAEADGGGLLAYNYYAGEPVTGFDEGRPVFARALNSRFTLPNFMRTLLYSSLGTLKIGMDVLTDLEGVKLEQMVGHGGFFKVKGVGQKFMAAALSVPVTVMASAGEGGAWGIALLAAYAYDQQNGKAEALETYLENQVFSGEPSLCITPDQTDLKGFNAFMTRYQKGFAIERAAVEVL